MCNCRYGCKRLSSSQREEIFTSFWALGDWQSQTNFIIGCVNLIKPKRSFVPSSRKQNSRIFKLNDIQVCKGTFLKTLGISNKRLDYSLRNKSKNGMASPDKRGKHPSCNKTSQQDFDYAKKFLESFPKYTSHYSSSEKQYFSPDLDASKLYEIYIEQISEMPNFSSVMPLSKRIFSRVLKEYKIGFYVPKSDTCKQCDEIDMKLKHEESVHEKAGLEASRNAHQTRAEAARTSLRVTKEQSKADPTLLAFCFDMQKTQPLPKLSTSVVFFRRQLWIYNTGIHTFHDNKGYMCLWTEGQGKRGSNEICSSLLQFLKIVNVAQYQTIKSYSDSCSGQNRNKNIICFFMYICDTFNIDS